MVGVSVCRYLLSVQIPLKTGCRVLGSFVSVRPIHQYIHTQIVKSPITFLFTLAFPDTDDDLSITSFMNIIIIMHWSMKNHSSVGWSFVCGNKLFAVPRPPHASLHCSLFLAIYSSVWRSCCDDDQLFSYGFYTLFAKYYYCSLDIWLDLNSG